MNEYLRSDGDPLTIPVTAPSGTDSIVFNVYDLDLEEYIQADESLAKRATITAATGNGTTITYTAPNTFAVGDIVTITGLSTTTGSSLNKSNVAVATRSSSQFTVTDSTIGTATAPQTGKALHITTEFNLVLNQDVTAYDRRLKIEIQNISSNTYTEDELYGNLVRPYATAQEIAEYGDITIVSSNPGLGEATIAQLVKQEKRARLVINSIISDSFTFKYKSVGTIGQGTDLLYLGQRVESYDKIIKDDEVVYDSTEDPLINILEYPIAISSSKYNLKITLPEENISEWTDVSVLKNHGFFEKNSSYIVRGEYGWKYIPVDINQAVCELASDMICSDYIYRKKGVKSIKNDAYAIEFNPGSATGNLIVDNLISPYKRFDIWAV
jgi:hypothetical protein